MTYLVKNLELLPMFFHCDSSISEVVTRPELTCLP